MGKRKYVPSAGTLARGYEFSYAKGFKPGVSEEAREAYIEQRQEVLARDSRGLSQADLAWLDRDFVPRELMREIEREAREEAFRPSLGEALGDKLPELDGD